MPRLSAESLSLAYDGTEVVHDVTVTIPEGRVSVVIGPNACGKSMLLRGLARLLRPTNGGCCSTDRSWPGWVPKRSPAAWDCCRRRLSRRRD